jgi:hypothetical protein
MNTELEALIVRFERLEHVNAALESRIATVECGSHRERRKLRTQVGLTLLALVCVLFLSPGNRQAIAQGYGITLASLNTRLTAVEAKTQFQSADSAARSTTFSRCNLIVNDGGGSTDTLVTNAAGNGLGNLIIGYNQGGRADASGDIRTGSHNLILGDGNNYSSYGGLVVGFLNTISAQYACVSGGSFNAASGQYASVSGGYGNLAGSYFASVSGGNQNIANNLYSSISGGNGNTASGQYASVSGGNGNAASNTYSSVSGGAQNTAGGIYSSVSGGQSSTASGQYTSVSGGYQNAARGNNATVSAGYGNTADGYVASISGGIGNSVGVLAHYATVSGGNGVAESDHYGWAGGAYRYP